MKNRILFGLLFLIAVFAVACYGTKSVEVKAHAYSVKTVKYLDTNKVEVTVTFDHLEYIGESCAGATPFYATAKVDEDQVSLIKEISTLVCDCNDQYGLLNASSCRVEFDK